MRILHVNSYYSGNNFFRNLYDKQMVSGLDIKVYVPVSTNVDTSALDLGDYTTISSSHNKYDRLIFHFKHKKIYNDIIKKYAMNEISIVHAHSLFSNGYIAFRLKKDFKIPYIVAVRNTDVNTFFKYMIHLRPLGVKIIQESEKVVFLSESYRDFVIKKYISAELREEILNKAVVIPNGIDDFWINNKGALKGKPGKDMLRLIYAGTVNRNKNLTTTIKAIEILRRKGYNIIFTVVGKIADKSIYRRITRLLYVNYIPPKAKENLLQIYSANDIFVMPSIHESFGLVYAEAMSQGLPVVYTEGQGFDGQFEEGIVGYHVNCLSAEDIAKKIVFIIEDYKEISNSCIKNVDKFMWKEISNEYVKIYGNIIKNDLNTPSGDRFLFQNTRCKRI